MQSVVVVVVVVVAARMTRLRLSVTKKTKTGKIECSKIENWKVPMVSKPILPVSLSTADMQQLGNHFSIIMLSQVLHEYSHFLNMHQNIVTSGYQALVNFVIPVDRRSRSWW